MSESYKETDGANPDSVSQAFEVPGFPQKWLVSFRCLQTSSGTCGCPWHERNMSGTREALMTAIHKWRPYGRMSWIGFTCKFQGIHAQLPILAFDSFNLRYFSCAHLQGVQIYNIPSLGGCVFFEGNYPCCVVFSGNQ